VLGLVIHMTSGQDSTTVAPDPTATTPADSGSSTTTPGGGNETQAGGSSTTPAPGSSGNNEGPDTTVDYCEPSLCPHGHLHVACNASMTITHRLCELDADIVPINERLQHFIVTIFNTLRNDVSKGGLNGLSPAARMSSVQWDPDLAYLAEFNVRNCHLSHDECRNTKKFPHAGQTVAYRAFKGNIPDLEDIIKDCFGLWLNENLNVHIADILKFKGFKNKPPMYNFLQLMLENNDHFGCAILQQTHNGWFQTYLTCNFAVALVKGKHIYTTSQLAGTGCKTGSHSIFHNLCSPDEKYDTEVPKADFAYLRAVEEEEPDPKIWITESDESDTKDYQEHEHHGIHVMMPNHEEFVFLQGDAAPVTTVAAGGDTTTAPAGGDTTTAAGGDNTTGGPDGNNQTMASTGEEHEGTDAESLVEPTTLPPDLTALQRKFARFIFLMDLAETASSHRKFVITTSNHEITDKRHETSHNETEKAARSRKRQWRSRLAGRSMKLKPQRRSR
ncbi:hypothetical protein KR067_012424, partial [Drosophila pandora]